MKKNLLGAVAAFLALSLLSCATGEHWEGVYAGHIPSASGEGIDVKITLNADETYKLEYRYIGRGNDAFISSGRFSWNSEKDTIILGGEREGDIPTYYKMGKKALIHLDIEGNVITGALANDYILMKQP